MKNNSGKDKNKGKKKNGLKVDFTGVESRGHLEDGQYPGEVSEVTQEEGNDHDYLKWEFVLKGEGEKWNNRKVYLNTSLSPKALWNLRNLLETLGVEVPDGALDLDFDEIKGLKLMLRIQNETWEGKDRPKVTDFTPMESESGDDDDAEVETEEDEPEAEEEGDEEEETDEEEPEADEEEDDEGKISADDVKEMDEDELKDLCKKHKLKVDFEKITKASKRIAAVINQLSEKDLLAE